MKVLLKIFLFTLVVVLLAAMFVPKQIVRSRMPVLDTSVQHASLNAEVTVTRDDWGVPHIQAETETDAYFAFGYTVAQDRLFQIEVLRRLSTGTLSEIVGEAGLSMDKISRTLMWSKMGEQLMEEPEKFSPEYLAVMQAYVAGVNHFIDTNPAPIEFAILGIEPQHITEVDTLAIQGYMAYGFAEGIRADSVYSMLEAQLPDHDVDELFPGYSNTATVTVMEGIVENQSQFTEQDDSQTAANYEGLEELVALVEETITDFGAFQGSNSWVMSPERSKSGGAILANDPHIGFTNPAVWYECHIRYEDFESYGVHLPLVPIAIIGHNATKGWAITMFENDDVDLYRETINPDDPGQVMYRGEWTPLQEWTESIPVKGGEPVDLTIRVTPHGPIITDMLKGYEGDPVSLWWMFHATTHASAETFYELGRASTVDEMRDAVAQLIAPGLNISYADADGNIAWFAGARIPIRPEHVNAKKILDGASGKDEVLGYMPFAENPQLVNPSGGLIVTSNNMSTIHPVGAIRELEGYWQPADRAGRIHDLLATQERWSLEELKAVQTDTALRTGHLLVDVMKRAMHETDESGAPYVDSLTEVQRQAYDALIGWDSMHGVDSTGATVHQFLMDALYTALLFDELGETHLDTYLSVADSRNYAANALVNDATAYWDNVKTEPVETMGETLRLAFESGVAEMVTRHDSDWSWGTAHTIEYPYLIMGQSPLSAWWTIGPYPAPSHEEGVAKMAWRETDYKVTSGASFRGLIDYANYGADGGGWFVLPTGNSGHLLSPHYDDQVEMYLRGEYRAMRLTDEDVAAHAEQVTTLKPGA